VDDGSREEFETYFKGYIEDFGEDKFVEVYGLKV